MKIIRLFGIGPYLQRHAARRDYYKVADQGYAVLAHLEQPAALDRDERAALLDEYAHLQDILGQTAAMVWPRLAAGDFTAITRPRMGQDDWPPGIHENAAHLVALLAAAERGNLQAASKNPLHAPLSSVFDDLRAAWSIGQRCEVLTRIYLAAIPIVGEDVADHVLLIRNAFERLALQPAVAAPSPIA